MANYIDDFLARMRARRGNLIFGMDATASREKTWDTAVALTAQMFQEIRTIGTLSMQFAYYRGVRNADGQCRFSQWANDPMTLASLMNKVTCMAGETQIERILNQVAKETLQRKIHAVVFVGDACEEERDVLVESATRLAGLSIPVFMFQEGADIVAKHRLEEIAQITKGAYFKFDRNCLVQLAETLSTIARFAVGGAAVLSAPERQLIGRR